MLGVSPVNSPKGDQDHGFLGEVDDFSVELDDNLLDYIDFSCYPFPSFDGDVLPDLEADPAELLAEFSPQGEDANLSYVLHASDFGEEKGFKAVEEDVKDKKISVKCVDEVLSAVTTEESVLVASDTRSSASAEGHSKRKSSSSSSSAKAAKDSHGKRKVKVDWTPDLHRRFVQAVEQLGIDKAVPSRILELMGIDCLTRHNIASHLQKYRSHRKHLLAREAEAASWSQKRQMYAPTGVHGTNDMNPWIAPTIGFPPHAPPAAMVHPFRPLHVWGHPTAVEPPLVPMWPRQPPPPWAPHPPVAMPPDPSYWQHHYNAARKGWVPHAVTTGAPCIIPQPVPPMRFPTPAPLVPGILPHPMYRPIPPPPSKHASLPFQIESQPSKETIDAAIGDVLVKPWLPLPLGLKPPAMESVMVELQKQGISKVPPTCG